MNTFKGNVIKEEIESLIGMRKRGSTEYYGQRRQHSEGWSQTGRVIVQWSRKMITVGGLKERQGLKQITEL